MFFLGRVYFFAMSEAFSIIVTGIECLRDVCEDYHDPFSEKVGTFQDARIWGVVPRKGHMVCLSCTQQILEVILSTRPVGHVGSLIEKEVRFTHVAAASGRHARQRQPFASRTGPMLEIPHIRMVLTGETRIVEEQAVDFKVVQFVFGFFTIVTYYFFFQDAIVRVEKVNLLYIDGGLSAPPVGTKGMPLPPGASVMAAPKVLREAMEALLKVRDSEVLAEAGLSLKEIEAGSDVE